MHALPRASLPHSRHSVSTTVQLFGADFARRTCFWAGIVDHVRPNPRPSRACRGDLNQPVLPPGCRLPPADAMTDVTQVSVRRELRSDWWRDQPPRRSRRVAPCEHRIITDGGGGWRVRCDEAWGEGNGTDDWTAPSVQFIRAAANVPVATEKKLNSPRCQARFSSRHCERHVVGRATDRTDDRLVQQHISRLIALVV